MEKDSLVMVVLSKYNLRIEVKLTFDFLPDDVPLIVASAKEDTGIGEVIQHIMNMGHLKMGKKVESFRVKFLAKFGSKREPLGSPHKGN